MNASEALFEARKQGATFTVNGKGQVKVSALLPLPQPLLVELRKHRAELIALLRQEPDYSATACVCDSPVDGTGSERCGVLRPAVDLPDVFTLPGLQAGTEVRQEGNQDLMPGGHQRTRWYKHHLNQESD
jgi:hypothetical protein